MMEIFLTTMGARPLVNQNHAMSAVNAMDGFCHGSMAPARLSVEMAS